METKAIREYFRIITDVESESYFNTSDVISLTNPSMSIIFQERKISFLNFDMLFHPFKDNIEPLIKESKDKVNEIAIGVFSKIKGLRSYENKIFEEIEENSFLPYDFQLGYIKKIEEYFTKIEDSLFSEIPYFFRQYYNEFQKHNNFLVDEYLKSDKKNVLINDQRTPFDIVSSQCGVIDFYKMQGFSKMDYTNLEFDIPVKYLDTKSNDTNTQKINISEDAPLLYLCYKVQDFKNRIRIELSKYNLGFKNYEVQTNSQNLETNLLPPIWWAGSLKKYDVFVSLLIQNNLIDKEDFGKINWIESKKCLTILMHSFVDNLRNGHCNSIPEKYFTINNKIIKKGSLSVSYSKYTEERKSKYSNSVTKIKELTDHIKNEVDKII